MSAYRLAFLVIVGCSTKGEKLLSGAPDTPTTPTATIAQTNPPAADASIPKITKQVISLPVPVAFTPPVKKVAESRPMLRLSLRSSPYGATVAVDGEVVGETPVEIQLPDDRKEHHFTFVLDGYAMERYKFVPVRDGAVPATMRLLVDKDDAGVP